MGLPSASTTTELFFLAPKNPGKTSSSWSTRWVFKDVDKLIRCTSEPQGEMRARLIATICPGCGSN
jgi:hypothetical protein